MTNDVNLSLNGRYKIQQVISKSSISIVSIAIDEKSNNVVAIKSIDRNLMGQKNAMKYVETELRLLQRVKHSSFPKVYDILYTQKYIHIIMEYLENGSLIELLEHGSILLYQDKVNICRKVLEGINYMHQRGICHRDIKPDNICLNSNNEPKIIDFGLSKEIFQEVSDTMCGTFLYAAPEVIKSQNYCGFKADVWSFGVTMHLIFTNKYPFEFADDAKYVSNVRNGKLVIRNLCTGVIGEIINDCLEINPELRKNSSELLLKFPKNYCGSIPISSSAARKVVVHTGSNITIHKNIITPLVEKKMNVNFRRVSY